MLYLRCNQYLTVMCPTTQIDRYFLIRVIGSSNELYSANALCQLLGTSRFSHIVSKAYRSGKDLFTYKHRSLGISIDFVSR